MDASPLRYRSFTVTEFLGAYSLDGKPALDPLQALNNLVYREGIPEPLTHTRPPNAPPRKLQSAAAAAAPSALRRSRPPPPPLPPVFAGVGRRRRRPYRSSPESAAAAAAPTCPRRSRLPPLPLPRVLAGSRSLLPYHILVG
ncbi:hypothetical protein PR202_ga20663 [Eleusine coracana subsp. coracana]|uniref:Uncharacterized protein n=1 Tax=Eleusine coracana subsp. coracana TaxID=191504 RepID=A0AAV5CYN6_ELECO|nr:hypothetical protein PR202_ga20663 [Eleusine coracana subsp. coracana]